MFPVLLLTAITAIALVAIMGYLAVSAPQSTRHN